MKVQPIVYVTDMDRATAWYSRLLDCEPAVAGGHWTTFPVGGAVLALHLASDALDAGSVELSLVTEESLEDVASRVAPHREIADEAFGRSMVVRDPDGTSIQVNEHDPDLYGP